MSAELLIAPLTSNLYEGELVPIPSPVLVRVIASEPDKDQPNAEAVEFSGK
jgi:hypothetical protein